MIDGGLKVGTEAVEVLVPRLFIDLGELEVVRGLPKGTITSQEGSVGNARSAVMDAYQNVVTLGATLVHRTMEKYRLQPDDIAGLMVGTESSLDEAVAINCRLVGALEQIWGEGKLRHWGFPESKGACAATGYNNYFACALFWSDEVDEDLKILSLATDDASYGLGSQGEPTRGSGGTLEIIGTEPIWELERGMTSRHIMDEYGFSRPFGQLHPLVKSKESIIAYNYLQRDGVDGVTAKAFQRGILDFRGKTIFDYIHRIIPHLPYFRMPKDCAAFLFRHVLRNKPDLWNPIIKKIGVEEPAHDGKGSVETIMRDTELWEKDKAFRKKIIETEEFREFFKKYFELALRLTPEIGNIYNGSLGLGKRSILEVANKEGMDLTGERHAFGYFGSGAISIAQTAIVQPKWKDVARDYHMLDELKPLEEGRVRHKIDIETYEMLSKLQPGAYNSDKSVLEPKNEFVISGIDNDGHLKYRFVG